MKGWDVDEIAWGMLTLSISFACAAVIACGAAIAIVVTWKAIIQ